MVDAMFRLVDIPLGPRTPGVYVLRLRGEPVFVGHSKNLLSVMYAHAQHFRGKPLLVGMPSRPVDFDSISVHPCRLEDREARWRDICEDLQWQP